MQFFHWQRSGNWLPNGCNDNFWTTTLSPTQVCVCIAKAESFWLPESFGQFSSVERFGSRSTYCKEVTPRSQSSEQHVPAVAIDNNLRSATTEQPFSIQGWKKHFRAPIKSGTEKPQKWSSWLPHFQNRWNMFRALKSTTYEHVFIGLPWLQVKLAECNGVRQSLLRVKFKQNLVYFQLKERSTCCQRCEEID